MAVEVIFNADLSLDVNKLLTRFSGLVDDEVTMLEIYNLFAKIIEPWVPMDKGVLAHGYEVTPNYLRYPGPYAHYQYIGEVYGPNFPIFDDAGQLVGFYSPDKKYPTGESLVYNTEKHERASKEWDKAAMNTVKDQFLEGVKAILIKRWGELYG